MGSGKNFELNLLILYFYYPQNFQTMFFLVSNTNYQNLPVRERYKHVTKFALDFRPFHLRKTLERMSARRNLNVLSTFRKRKKDKDTGSLFLT